MSLAKHVRTLNLLQLMAAACLVGLLACGSEDLGEDQFGETSDPKIGLYTPGNTVGKIKPDDGGVITQEDIDKHNAAKNGGKNQCATPAATLGMTEAEIRSSADPTQRSKTPASMTVKFVTKNPNGKWQPANIGAVWISDTQDNFVRRLELWAQTRIKTLFLYPTFTCTTGPDVIATPTLADHSKQHSETWNGEDFQNHVVPDGHYKLYIEVADSELNTGKNDQVAFDKGTMPFSMSISTSNATTGIEIAYTPTK